MVAGRIATAISAPIELFGTEVEISTSIGIALADPDTTRTGDELIRDSDVAMYAAKNTRTGTRVFDEHLDRDTLDRLAIEPLPARRPS